MVGVIQSDLFLSAYNVNNMNTQILICILNEDEICRVRRAVAEKTNIKRIITNCSKYVHATREMAVHLTRQTLSALSIHTNDIACNGKTS